jgi:hypothetical protein
MHEAKTLGIQNPGTMTFDALMLAIARAKEGDNDPNETSKENTGASGRTPPKKELVAEATALGIDRPNNMTVPQLVDIIAKTKAAIADKGDNRDVTGNTPNGDNNPEA